MLPYYNEYQLFHNFITLSYEFNGRIVDFYCRLN